MRGRRQRLSRCTCCDPPQQLCGRTPPSSSSSAAAAGGGGGGGRDLDLTFEKRNKRDMKVLLSWVALTQRIERHLDKQDRYWTFLAYDVWEAAVNHPVHQPDNDCIVSWIHRDCKHAKDVWNQCRRITWEDEKIILKRTSQLSKDPDYFFAVRDMVRNSERPALVSTAFINKLLKSRGETEDLICSAFLRGAVWRYFFEQQLTILEAFLCSRSGLRQLGLSCHLDLLEQCYALLECYDNCTKCIGCGRRPRKKAHPLGCAKCKRVYYCSVKCKQMNVIAHEYDECHFIATMAPTQEKMCETRDK